MTKFDFYQVTVIAYYRKSINLIIEIKRKKRRKQHVHFTGFRKSRRGSPLLPAAEDSLRPQAKAREAEVRIPQ